MQHTQHAKRWLVVDDNPVMLALTTRVLRSLPGSEVVACDNPGQALEVFMAEPESFEMLVTDLEMPEFDGLELSRRVRARSPRLHVLLISGSDLEAADVLGAGLDAYLPKVGLAAELLEVVRTVLASEPHHAGRGTPASIA